MSVTADKVSKATNPIPATASAANSTPVTAPKPVSDTKTSSDKVSTSASSTAAAPTPNTTVSSTSTSTSPTLATAATPASSPDQALGDLKERLAAVVEEATTANSDGRATVGNLFSALKLGQYSVTACDRAVVLLDEILKSLDKNSLIYQELNTVQTGAKKCDAQAKGAVVAINLVAGAALVALAEGDVALGELLAIYNSLPSMPTPESAQKSQPKDALASLSANLKDKADTLKKAAIAQTSLQTQAATLESLRQRLAFVVAEASKSNNDGRVAVSNIVAAQALGSYSVVACNQAVFLLDEILKTLDKSSKIYKELCAVQNKAKDVNKKSHEAMVVINDLVVNASAALALGDGSLRALLAVNETLKALFEAKPAPAVTFSPTGSSVATASGAGAPGTAVTSDAATQVVSTNNSCRIA